MSQRSSSNFNNLIHPHGSGGAEDLSYHDQSLIGNGVSYDTEIESALQENYIYRWPVPFIPGIIEVNVQIHYVHLNTNSVPATVIDNVISEVEEIYGDQDIQINFLNQINHQVYGGLNYLDELHHDYFTNQSGNIAPNALNIAIFDPVLVLTNGPFFSYPSSNGVHIHFESIPALLASIAFPDQSNVEEILTGATGGVLGIQMGLFPTNFHLLVPGSIGYFVEEENNCNYSGDFICQTSGGNMVADLKNIMTINNPNITLTRNLTEEQARKIRYNFANDADLYNCLTSNSTLDFDNFMLVPMFAEINSNTTWDKPAATLRIVVKDNATFTVNNRIDFAPGLIYGPSYFQGHFQGILRTQDLSSGYNNEIIFDDSKFLPGISVEAGSKLLVENTSLEGYYSYWPWQGIHGQGNSSAPQTFQNQAVIELKNAKIVKAHNAFNNFHRDFGTEEVGDYSSMGSIIFAEDTEFINCRRTAQFLRYYNNHGTHLANDLSYFRKCKIIHDDDYPFPSKPLGITMYKVNGIQIRGCEFINTITDVEGFHGHRGDAIVSIDATYTLNIFCDDPECMEPFPSIIAGYQRGITSSKKSHPLKSIRVNNTTFYNNFYGAYFNDQSNNLTFTQNTLIIPEGVNTESPFMSNHPYGLYVHNSRSFTIEENLFTIASAMVMPPPPLLVPIPNPNPSVIREPIGLIVNNTLTASDQIYKNTFEELDLGILALEFNRVGVDNNGNNYYSREGLQLRCNDFTDGEYDIYAPEPINSKQNTLAGYQGRIQRNEQNEIINHLLAGNRFSHTNSTSGYYDFEYNADGSYDIIYFSHDPISEPRVEPRYDHIHDVVNSPADVDFSEHISCPSNLNQGGVTISDLASLRVQMEEIESDRVFLGDLIDGGSTPELIAEIFTTPESEFYDLYINLMAESPYLSEEALIEIIHREGFPDILLRNILIENPESYINQAVWDEVLNRTPPLPQFMIDDILNGSDYIGAKQLLQARIVGKQLEAERMANQLIDMLGEDYASGELLTAVDSAIAIYDLMDMPHYYLQKALLLHAEGLSGVSEALDDMVEHPAVGNGFLKDEFDAIKEVYEIIFAKDDTLSSGQIAALKAIESGSQNAAAATAHFMLALEGLQDSLLVDPTYYPMGSPPHKRNVQDPAKVEKKSPNHLRLYPNPANDFTTLHYQTTGIGGKTTYQIFDMSGRVVCASSFEAKVEGAELIELPSLATGMYVLKLFRENGELLGTEKLQIQQRK
ncbi:MAG: T9SS type A sorting domain-containing protein [Cryomorphaceae bacterium]|nr:T9SS type A sorting domain-containing protein [Cryomorphaceae bacterium]